MNVKIELLVIFMASFFLNTSAINLESIFQPENVETVKAMKIELEKFQIDMTKSFMEAHSRQKRALSDGFVKDMNIAAQRFVEIKGESVGPFSTFTFEGIPYLIKRDGIREISGLLRDARSMSAREALSSSRLKLVGKWALPSNEIVLNGYEWKHNMFLLTTNGTFSTIYTMHENTLNPIFRQRIFNRGNAVAAQFFEHRRNLFLIMCNDNEIHSTTFSAIFRWAGSYMDEIHQVQTTGATAVETFTINSKKYIAIAQSRDSAGNMELGTLVLSMNNADRLERVQLLWSNGARDLHYMTTEKEHFLVIAQEKEPSIAYWFGGMDFIFWQQFEGLQGQNAFLNGYQLESDQPIFIASDGGPLRIFTRLASSATKLMTTWVESKTFDSRQNSNAATSTERLTQAKFLQVKKSNSEESKPYLALTTTLTSNPNSEESIKIFTLNIDKKPLSITGVKGTQDSLSQCLHTLKNSLNDAQPILFRIQEEGPKVLRTDKNINFDGILETKGIIKMDPSQSNVKRAQITPQSMALTGRSGSINSDDDESLKSSPSKLLANIGDDNDRLNIIKGNMANILYKSHENKEVTGNLEFTGPIQFDTLDVNEGAGDLKVDIINNVAWSDLQTKVLKINQVDAQQITGEWSLESLKAENVFVTKTDSILSPDTFMLTTCPQNQTVEGLHRFHQTVGIPNGIVLSSNAKINDHLYSDLVMKEDTSREIKGFKHAPIVKGSFTPQNVNNVNIKSWFESVAKINSLEEQRVTGSMIFEKNSRLKINNLFVTELNSVNWNSFQSSVMLNGQDQEVEGFVEFDTLKIDQLQTNSILGVKTEELLTSSGQQHISSVLSLESMHISENLSTEDINNGARLQNAVSRTALFVEIRGPVALKNCEVQDILVTEGVTIAGKDVSELNKLQKIHIYSATDGSPIILDKVNAEKLFATKINGKILNELGTNYWSKTRNNVINASQLVISDRAVTLSGDNFISDRVNDFRFPDEFVSLDQNEIILNGQIRFEKPVTFSNKVEFDDGVTVQGMDISNVESMIVDENFRGLVRGKKTFSRDVVAESGATFINGFNDMNLLKDVVMLNSNNLQTITGTVKFREGVQSKAVTVQNGDVSVDGHVNGLNLEYVKETTAYRDKINSIEGKVTFVKSVEATKYSSEMLNNINIAEIRDNMVFLNHSEEQVMEGGLQLENVELFFFANAGVREVNSVPLLEYLTNVVRLDSVPNEIISGTKTFKNVLINGQLHCSTINDVNLMELKRNALSKTKSQDISGKWSMNDAIFKSNLEIEEISGIQFSNLVFTDEHFEVTSPVEFISEEGGSIRGPLHVTGEVNGIKFDENFKKFATLLGDKKFENLIVNGDLEWSNDNEHPGEAKGLSYFLHNAVQKNGEQTILGEVHITKGIKTKELFTGEDQWLDGINLQMIKDDAVLRNDQSWRLSGNNVFRNPLHIENLAGSVGTADIENINGINLVEMDRDIYKSNDNSGRILEGEKHFTGEIEAVNVDVRDQLSGSSINELVLKNDPRQISQVHFKDLTINRNMNWEKASGIDLESLLANRVSLTKPQQQVEGPFTFEEISVENLCQVEQINTILVNNTVRRDVVHLPIIVLSGKKIFAESLHIDGAAKTASINEHPVKELMEQTLHLDKEEIITRPVIFENAVVVNQPVELQSLNEVHLEDFSARVTNRLERLVTDAQGPDHLAMDLNNRESLLQRFTEERPTWLEYLRLKEDLTHLGAKTKVDHMTRNEFGDILVSFHHPTKDAVGEVGLPNGCSCNTVNTLQIKETLTGRGHREAKVNNLGTENCLKVYHAVSKTTGTTYTVTSETFSTNSSCISEMDKTTKIFAGQELLGEMKLGDISDLGVFSDKETDYLVLAQYFDAHTRSHSTKTRVMRIDGNGMLENVQNIPTHGANKVALGYVNGRWMLAVANSKKPTEDNDLITNDESSDKSCVADSAIYIWSSNDETFLLLRNVMTDGVFDVKFLTTQAGNEFYTQNFVAFAQQGDSASGEVLIFRYENIGGNFAMTQTIRSQWPITALETACICNDCFLMTTVPQEGITFYENQFVEGFREYYKAPVFGATDITSFTLDSQYLFAVATRKGPILAEAVMSGPGSCQIHKQQDNLFIK